MRMMRDEVEDVTLRNERERGAVLWWVTRIKGTRDRDSNGDSLRSVWPNSPFATKLERSTPRNHTSSDVHRIHR